MVTRMFSIALLATACVYACAPPANPGEPEHAGATTQEARRSLSMSCAQATGGCTPEGYRTVGCVAAGVSGSDVLVLCVAAPVCVVLGQEWVPGERCAPPSRHDRGSSDFTSFLPVLPDDEYEFVLRVRQKDGSYGPPLASVAVHVFSSVGADTQCGGPAWGCIP